MTFIYGRVKILVAGTMICALAGCGGPGPSQYYKNGKPPQIPGRVEAEDFDNGPDGIAFHVSSANRAPQAYRRSAVKISAVVPAGLRVTDLAAGDWLAYTVRVARDGAYVVRVRSASVGCGGSFHIEFAGRDVTGPLKVPNTCSSDRDWEDVEKDGVTLKAGQQTMRLVVDTPGLLPKTAGNIDYLEVVESTGWTREIPESHPSAADVRHPRLFVTEKRLAEIRVARRSPLSHHSAVLKQIQERVRTWMRPDAKLDAAELPAATKVGLAQEAALLYLVTQDTAYADFAFAVLRSFLADGSKRQLIPYLASEFTELPVERSAVGMAFGITFDWCYNAWTPEQRAVVRQAIEEALNVWPCIGHKGLESPFDTPPFGAFRGAELVMTLAIGQESTRGKRFGQLRRWLLAHVESGYSESGLAPTGAEVDVAGAFVLPAAYALLDVGDSDLVKSVARRSWWKLAMIADLMVETQVASDIPHAGWRNLLFPSVPREYVPYYRWVYDHRLGRDASVPSYEGAQGGAVWAVLYYPERVEPRDPTGVVPTSIADRTLGAFTWRSDWRDKQAIVLAAFADAAESESALDLPRAFNLALQAGGRTLIKELPPKPDLASSLLVDGRSFDFDGRRAIGRVEQCAEEPGGTTTVVIDGSAKYSRLGLQSARRLVWVDRSPPNGTPMLWSTLDQVRASTEHVYAWQINLGTIGNAAIEVSARAGQRPPTFLARWSDGTGLQGWVLSPENAVVEMEKCRQCGVKSDQLLRVAAKGANETIWVVVAAFSGDRRAIATVSGAGLGSVIDFAGARLRFDEKKQSLFGERRASPSRRTGQGQ